MSTGAPEVDSPLISPDLALDRLHLVVPDGSDAMVVLATLAHGADADDDPRAVFAKRLAELGHLTVSFHDDDPRRLGEAATLRAHRTALPEHFAKTSVTCLRRSRRRFP